MENEDIEQEEVDALCRECGHAFKTYVDRMILPEKKTEKSQAITCPVCGCGECNIGK
jgi:DNA-directed RNA polymerase subunit RPC12/RpoP